MKYDKPALEAEALLNRWIAKGLEVENREVVLHDLTYIGYFRLRGYALPWMVSGAEGRTFRPGTRYETIRLAYEFDRELRGLLLRELERIEVAVRTVISNTLSAHGGPHWFLQDSPRLLGPTR